ncbi:hypothetical protein FRC08_016499, partial [Ceratobasidium sp. 394]
MGEHERGQTRARASEGAVSGEGHGTRSPLAERGAGDQSERRTRASERRGENGRERAR